MMTSHVLTLHILHCCEYYVKQLLKCTFRSTECVLNLAAIVNIMLENVFYTWGNAQNLWVPLSYQQDIILARRSVLGAVSTF